MHHCACLLFVFFLLIRINAVFLGSYHIHWLLVRFQNISNSLSLPRKPFTALIQSTYLTYTLTRHPRICGPQTSALLHTPHIVLLTLGSTAFGVEESTLQKSFLSATQHLLGLSPNFLKLICSSRSVVLVNTV